MEKLNFTKMAGAGNDFVVIGAGFKGLSALAKRLCDRKAGIGADGMLVLEKSKTADFRMRIFNADGSEAEMCGIGLRCAVLFKGMKRKVKVETIAGIYGGEITAKDRVKIGMEEPGGLKVNFPINVNGREIKANFINTGVPHTVVFVEGLDKIDVDSIGSGIRYHDEFKPKGSNVNFVEIVDDRNIKIRTYERGVEGETLACGTGSVASAIISTLKAQGSGLKVNVHTKGGVLKVEFDNIKNKIKNVYLEGEAKIVFQGGIYV
ncbi:MAG: diaminopimelate epimerase [Candidatus Omnitrophica bacterium CG_4_9_14_0_2_um_filter_42_8]|nr:MAG: diaminopimelate epimerase [Candidatus Omnitrophica bacterium CG_4_9_14_0_2_um_filter_42_8]